MPPCFLVKLACQKTFTKIKVGWTRWSTMHRPYVNSIWYCCNRNWILVITICIKLLFRLSEHLKDQMVTREGGEWIGAGKNSSQRTRPIP
jgi:hypothetical protein